jgi:hypothetical protein
MISKGGRASITVDDLLVLPALAAWHGLTRNMDAATAPASGSWEGQLATLTALLTRACLARWSSV